MNDPLVRITAAEAERWLESLTHEKLIEFLRDYRVLRNSICERNMGVATGCGDWLQRSVDRSYFLAQCETTLRQVVAGIDSASLSAKLALRQVDCRNCSGLGVLGGPQSSSACPTCKGTGRQYYC